MWFLNNKKTDEQKLYDDISNTLEHDVLDTIEMIVGDVNRLGCFDLFNYFHKKERGKKDYVMVEGYNQRQNYLLNQEQRINCAYEKVLEDRKMYEECSRRG
jgi:hypothetical protein